MTNQKTLRRSLLSSVIALLVCFAMLLGTTFAWFTDSVKSGVNRIVAGNLDVELWHSTYLDSAANSTWGLGFGYSEEKGVEVDENTQLFLNEDKQPILWEPGAQTLENFRIKNVGSLAVKFAFKVEVANATKTPEGRDLTEILDLSIDKINWQDNGVPSGTTILGTTKLGNGFTFEGQIPAGENYDFAVGLEWQPSENDNAYNVKGGLDLDLGVKLLATQATYEKDGVGGNQYDAGASLVDDALVYGGTLDVEETITEKVVVSYGAEVEMNLNENTVENTVINKGTLTLNGDEEGKSEINVDAAGFINEGTATVENVTMNAGSTTDYSNISRGAEANTTYDNVTIDSKGGGIGATGGAQVTFNSGEVAINSASTSARYNIYAYDEGSNVTINGGTFSFSKTLNQKRAYVYAGAGATVTINGGTFGKASSRSGYTAGILGEGTIIIKGGTFGFDPSTWVAEGYTAVKNGSVWAVTKADADAYAFTADNLVAALESNEDVKLMADVKIEPASMSNAYGTTGINIKNGQTLDGNGNTLDIKGAGGTWDSGINTTGGVIKNITVTGSFRGIFINHNSEHSERVILENVIIDGTTYTISCDQGMNQGLTATNSTFKGWTSYAKTLGDAKFIDCYFGYGNGYSFCRPYAPTEFVGCNFEAGFKLDPIAAVTFENCTIGGVALTAENLATLVTNTANATVK